MAKQRETEVEYRRTLWRPRVRYRVRTNEDRSRVSLLEDAVRETGLKRRKIMKEETSETSGGKLDWVKAERKREKPGAV